MLFSFSLLLLLLLVELLLSLSFFFFSLLSGFFFFDFSHLFLISASDEQAFNPICNLIEEISML